MMLLVAECGHIVRRPNQQTFRTKKHPAMQSQNPLLTAPIGPTLTRMAAPNVIAMFITLTTSMAEAWYVGYAQAARPQAPFAISSDITMSQAF
jgi:hypothetical protein